MKAGPKALRSEVRVMERVSVCDESAERECCVQGETENHETLGDEWMEQSGCCAG